MRAGEVARRAGVNVETLRYYERRGLLHVTNGESAGNTLRQISLGGAVLSWQDVLHEGPVPAGPRPGAPDRDHGRRAAPGRPPLGDARAFAAMSLRLTPAGERALRRQADRVQLLGVDRWIGGCHVTPGTAWRWDPAAQRLLPPA